MLQDHLLVSIIDSLNLTAYYSMIAASAQVDKKSWNKVQNGAPKPMQRPGRETVRNVQVVSAAQGGAAVKRIMERKSKGG